MAFEVEIEVVRDAARRTRWLYSALLVCALCQLAVYYNFNFSWNEQFQDSAAWLASNRGPAANEIKRKVHEKVIDLWVESTYVDVPLLGVKASVSDSSVFGSIAMAILSVWLFFSSRRENHLVHIVLSSGSRAEKKDRNELLHGVVASQVMSPTSDNDDALSALHSPTPDHATRRVPRTVSSALQYLPTLVITTGIVLDLGCAIRDGFMASHWVRLTLMSLVGISCALLCGHMAMQHRKFQRATGSLIRAFAIFNDTNTSIAPPASQA
jgi:hypothetical protein